MSTIQYTGLSENQDWLFDAMDASVRQQTADKAIYQDNDTGDQWILEGFGLQYNAQGGLAGGTVTKMIQADGDDQAFVTYTGFFYNVPANRPLFEINTGLSLFVTQGNDDLRGSTKDDYVNGGQGDDFAFANKGNDDLRGEDGNDVLKGGGGKDFIWAGRGNDWVTGGSGKDAFQFLFGEGLDTITDFNVRKDVFYADWESIDAIYQVGDDTVIDWGDGDMLTLIDVAANQINENLFI